MLHITQEVAPNIKIGAAFNVYVTSKRSITRTRIAILVNKTTAVNNTEVKHVSIHSAENKLCLWLEVYSDVAAHNRRRFDFPVLMTVCIDWY